MNTQMIIEEVNQGLAVANGGPFVTNESPENFHRTDLRGELDGRSIRIEISVQDERGPYQYSIALFDEETGERLGRGNGGPTLNDAASVFQWNNALSDLRALKR